MKDTISANDDWCCDCVVLVSNIAGFCGCQNRVKRNAETCADCQRGQHDNNIPSVEEFMKELRG